MTSLAVSIQYTSVTETGTVAR